jgi:hypothetical protein
VEGDFTGALRFLGRSVVVNRGEFVLECVVKVVS